MADQQNPSYKPRGGVLGAPTEFNSSQYQTKGMMYPDDLMREQDNPYGGNYVIFYINVHEDSMLVKQGSGGFVQGDVPPRQRGEAAGLSAGGVTAVAAVAGAGAANAADVAGKVSGNLSKVGKAVANTTVGAIGGAAVVAAVGGAKNEYKRQVKAIALHVPTDLTIKYGMVWEETDLAGSTAIAAGAENLGKLNIGAAAGGTAGYLAGLALKTPGAGQLLGKTSGTAANPKKEQLFKEVDYRTFTFTYQFFPRSAEEAANCRAIINEFKLHMHPEFKANTGNFLYIYPSEFDIFYYNNGRENLNLHRHTSCVLTDMNVSYSPQGVFTSFADGMPTQINVQLTFKELALLTKENIQDGF